MTTLFSAPCRAPWTSLHFDQHGWVTACTANKRDPLGHVGRSTLAEIWSGPRAERFRATFSAGELAEGCDLCRWQQGHGGDATMYARLYDDAGGAMRPDGPVHLEFAVSNRCNLACQMCNGGLSSTIRRHEGLPALPSAYPDRFFDELVEWLPAVVQAKFLGGEPFLAPENFRIWEAMAAADEVVPCHVTTNGTIWNDRVADVLDRQPMSFAVSLDGATASTVERIRAGARFADVLVNIDRFRAHAARHGTGVSLTFCLMRDNWHELPDFLVLAEDLGLSTFVNTVLSPFRLSVYQLDEHELAEIVAALEAQSPRLESVLDRNLTVWEDQLARLRASGGDLAAQAETPVHFPSFSPPRLDNDPVVMDAAAELRRWAPVEPACIQVEPGGRIAGIESRHLAGLNLDRLVGAGIDELFVWLHSAFGRPDASEYLRHGADLGDRLLRFEAAEASTEVRVISSRTAAGAQWLLSTRPAASGVAATT